MLLRNVLFATERLFLALPFRGNSSSGGPIRKRLGFWESEALKELPWQACLDFRLPPAPLQIQQPLAPFLVKGTHPITALAFLVASTYLMLELGVILWVLLSWHLLVDNFLLGMLMIVYACLLTRFWSPKQLADYARSHAEAHS